jgi:hypothetical protein
MTVEVADRIEQWMRENPGQHVFSEIARGVKLADVLVREALRDDERFSSRERAAYDADRAVVFFLPSTSVDGSRRARKRTQVQKVEAVLADGRWHTAEEIHKRCGFMRLNSRIAELRDPKGRGLNIECERIAGVPNGAAAYRYRLTPVATSEEAAGAARVARAEASFSPAASSGVSSRDRCEGEPGEASADHQLSMPVAA